jgi:hypothetical protein
MRRIVVINHLTLDGVMQAPGRPDEDVLMIHPLVLGTGRRMFPDDGPRLRLRLVDSVTTTTGVMIGTYRPAGPATAETA